MLFQNLIVGKAITWRGGGRTVMVLSARHHVVFICHQQQVFIAHSRWDRHCHFTKLFRVQLDLLFSRPSYYLHSVSRFVTKMKKHTTKSQTKIPYLEATPGHIHCLFWARWDVEVSLPFVCLQSNIRNQIVLSKSALNFLHSIQNHFSRSFFFACISVWDRFDQTQNIQAVKTYHMHGY